MRAGFNSRDNFAIIAISYEIKRTETQGSDISVMEMVLCLCKSWTPSHSFRTRTLQDLAWPCSEIKSNNYQIANVLNWPYFMILFNLILDQRRKYIQNTIDEIPAIIIFKTDMYESTYDDFILPSKALVLCWLLGQHTWPITVLADDPSGTEHLLFRLPRWAGAAQARRSAHTRGSGPGSYQ